MSPLGRRRSGADGVAPRRPHAGRLRRERRGLLKARAEAISHLGGLLVEMYRRGSFRDDLIAERCSVVLGIDARLAEIDDLLHARREIPRCACGAPLLRGAHFCPTCGRSVDAAGDLASDATIVEPRSVDP
jgi:hypothetical protein